MTAAKREKLTAAERSVRARIAANSRWSRPMARTEASLSAREAKRRYLIKQVDPDGLLSGPELEAALSNARQLIAARLQAAKARKQRERSGNRVGEKRGR